MPPASSSHSAGMAETEAEIAWAKLPATGEGSWTNASSLELANPMR